MHASKQKPPRNSVPVPHEGLGDLREHFAIADPCAVPVPHEGLGDGLVCVRLNTPCPVPVPHEGLGGLH